MRHFYGVRWLFAIVLGLVLGTSQAQVSSTLTRYTYGFSAGTYTPITPANTLWSGAAISTDDAIRVNFPNGFVFGYNEQLYSSVVVHNNGYITFGPLTSAATVYTPISTGNGTPYEGAVSGFGANLVASTASGAAPLIGWSIEGTGTNEVFVLQFTDVARTASAALDRVTFQIRLNESTHTSANQIRIVYGSNSTTSNSTTYPQVGLRGNNSSDYNNRNAASGTPWSSTTNGTANTSTIAFLSTQVPASGTTFTWTAAAFLGAPTKYVLTAGSPFIEYFESTWSSRLATEDVPGANWAAWPGYGNTSWRRQVNTTDPGASSGWTSVTSGRPTGNSTGYARFHSWASHNDQFGYMDLHMNMSTPGNKLLKFSWINTNSSTSQTPDNLTILLSTDNGANFTQIGYYNNTPAWRRDSVNVISASANTVIRFRALADFGATDIGLDSIEVRLASNCSGTPSNTRIAANEYILPSGQSTILGITANNPTGNGITYQWQETQDTLGTWSSVVGGSGGTSTNFTTNTSKTDLWYYRLRVTCTNSGQSSVSNPVGILHESGGAYCLPINTNTTCNGVVNSIISASASFLVTSPGCTGGISSKFKTINPARGGMLNLLQNGNYGISLTTAANSTSALWIDFDGDGDFSTAEYLLLGSNTTAHSGTIIVPGTSVTGFVRARLRTTATTTAITDADACASFASGNSYDFVVKIAAPAGCTGTPVAGTISANSTTICSTNPTAFATLTASGTTIADGISFLWQSSANGTSGWATIPSATSATYDTDPAQSGTLFFRLIVTCDNSGLKDTTNVVSITKSILGCYCTPVHTSFNSVSQFDITGTTLNHVPTPASAPGYYTYPASGNTTASLVRGQSYTANVATGTTSAIISIWIDFNQNGAFEVDEWYQPYTTGTSGSSVINVPIGAVEGVTRMRLRMRTTGSANSSGDFCTSFASGSSHDYLVTITAPPPCTGTPNTPTIGADSYLVNASSTTTVSISGNFPTGSGLTFQWQNTQDTLGTWVSAPSGTSGDYTTPAGRTGLWYYRLVTTCTNSSASSTSGHVAVMHLTTDLCTPTQTGTGCSALINSLEIVGTGLQIGTQACQTGPVKYRNFEPRASRIASVQRTGNYTLNMTTSSAATSAVWFDWNNDGVYATNEWYQINNNNTSASVVITIPDTAVLGIIPVRIRTRTTTTAVPNTAACASATTGFSYEFVTRVAAAPGCSGKPNAPLVSADSSTLCSSIAISSATLSSSGGSFGIGISYQWQNSTNGTVWNDIPSATGSTYDTPGSLSGQMFYRVIILCSNSGQRDTSNVESVTKSFVGCYCKTGLGGSTSPCISTLSISGTGFSNTASSCGTPYPNTFPTSGSTTATLLIGSTYTVNLTTSTTSITSVWIDFDQDGVFEASEWVQPNTTGTSGTADITIPVGAIPGVTGMRVRSRSSGNANGSGDACLNMATGATQDYFITLQAPVACSGTPNPGTTEVSGGTQFCAGVSTKTLTVTGSSVASGLTFQWQSSPTGSGYTDVSGATSVNYTTPVLSSAVFYRLKVTCTNSGQTAFSNGIQLTPSVVACYCQDPATLHSNACATSRMIDSVKVLGTSFNYFNGACVAGQLYRNINPGVDSTVSVEEGQSFNLKVRVNGSLATFIYAWVDFNGNGLFESSEFHTVTTTGQVGTVNIPVPAGSFIGQVRMRIRTRSAAMTGNDACLLLTTGMTRDFTITITPPPPCTGTPASANLSSTAQLICPTQTTSLSFTGGTAGVGITYQWQRSTNGTTFANISGATNPSYLQPAGLASGNYFYRLRTTCTTSGQSSFSDTLMVTVNSLICDYCNPPHTAIAGYITKVRMDGTSLNMTPPVAVLPAYYRYAPKDSTTATVYKGQTYSLFMSANAAGLTSVWIDYNQNGVFETTEWAQVYPSGTSGSVLLTIPTTALSGMTGMRVRSRTTGSANGATDACLSFGSGSTIDFLINILTPPNCSGTPAVPTVTASSMTPCFASNVSLSFTPALGTGLTYQWQYSPDGTTWTNIPGATGISVSGPALIQRRYRVRVQCSFSGQTVFSAPIEPIISNPITAAPLPYNESFENWTSVCGTGDRISAHMAATNPISTTAGQRNAWRRYDFSSFTTSGQYTPASVAGSFSARFNTFGTDINLEGSMYLMANFGFAGTKTLSYHYINPAWGSPEAFFVELSSDGVNWTKIDSVKAVVSSWTRRSVSTTLQANPALIRFRAISNDGAGAADMGLDSLSVTTVYRWTASAGAAWTNGGSWNAGTTPPAGSIVEVYPSTTPPVISTTLPTLSEVRLYNGATVTLDGANTLTISGKLVHTGSNPNQIGRINGTGTITFTSGTKSIEGRVAIPNLSISNSGTTVNLSSGSELRVARALSVTAGTLALAGNRLTLESNGSYTGYIDNTTGSITGATNVASQRWFDQANVTNTGAFQMVATPIVSPSVTVGTFRYGFHTGIGTLQGPSTAWSFDPTNTTAFGAGHPSQGWYVPAALSTPVPHGTGIRLFFRNEFFATSQGRLEHVGAIHQGPYSWSSLGYNSTTSNGFNMIGNPYASAIDWTSAAWTRSNVNPTYWIWDHSEQAYVFYNAVALAGTGPTTLNSHQGFFVERPNSGVYTLSVTEAAKVAPSTNSPRRTGSSGLITATLSNGTNSDMLLLNFRPDATDGYENLDSRKMMGSLVNLYSTRGGIQYALDSRALTATTDSTEMAISSSTQGNHTLRLTGINNLPAGYQVILKDRYLGTQQAVIEGMSYAFATNSSPASQGNRFVLVYQASTTGIGAGLASSAVFRLYPNPSEGGSVFVELGGLKAERALVRVLDALGREVQRQEIMLTAGSLSTQALNTQLGSGVYFVEVLANQQKMTQRLVVK